VNTTTTTQIFPQNIEATITFKIRVSDQEQRDYWLNPETGAVSVETLADLMDNYTFDGQDEHIISINNLTKTQLQQILNIEAAL